MAVETELVSSFWVIFVSGIPVVVCGAKPLIEESLREKNDGNKSFVKNKKKCVCRFPKF